MKKEVNKIDEGIVKYITEKNAEIDSLKKDLLLLQLKKIPVPPKIIVEEKKIITEEKKEEKITNSGFIEKIYKINKKHSNLYIVCFFNIIVAVSVVLYFYFAKISFLGLILSVFISIPIVLLSLLMIIIRFWFWDKKKVKDFIVVKLSNNYVIATIFKAGKRITKKICLINPDGKTITDGKKDYTIDNAGVWVDDDKNPNIFALDNLPNNLLFAFAKDLNDYVRTLIAKKTIPSSEGGFLIDVSYSSENLQLLKKDKIFAELHRNPDTDKIIMMLIGLVVVLIIAMVIIILTIKK